MHVQVIPQLDLFRLQQKRLTNRFTTENKLLKSDLKPIQFMTQFFTTNPPIQQPHKEENKALYQPSRPTLKLTGGITDRPHTDLFIRDLSTERSTRFGDVLQNTFYKTIMKPKSFTERTNLKSNIPNKSSQQLTRQKSNRVQFEDIDHGDHLASQLKRRQNNYSMPDEKIDPENTLKQIQTSKEALGRLKPRWLSEKVFELEKKFIVYDKNKHLEPAEKTDGFKSKYQPLFQFYLSCIFADSIFQKKFTTLLVMKEYIKSNKQNDQALIDADQLFLDVIANIGLISKMIQSKKVVVVVLMKIPGFNSQIKGLLFKIKPNKSVLDLKEEVLLKDGLSAQMLMVQFIIGFDVVVPQFQVEALEDMILQGSGLNQLLSLPQRQGTKRSEKSQVIEQVMQISSSNTLMNYIKDLNLDMEFIKKLDYYNKNLEEYVEMLLNRGVQSKMEELDNRKQKISNGIINYLHGDTIAREKTPSEKKKLLITGLLDTYKIGQKSQILYHSHILSQLQHQENNTGSFGRITMGTRMVFQNINDQALGYRQ